jgi:alkanesulfonate monooxygenase SsuD/methylene tetrahydromethanopterin reductase-like flavin-dependent oxidoreductase (luciferase family)
MAKAVATAGVIAPGRIVAGLSARWNEHHFIVEGIDFGSRAVGSTRSRPHFPRYSSASPQFHGRHIDFDELLIRPVPNVRIPILLGGASAHARRRAVRFGDGWIGPIHDPEGAFDVLAEVRAERQAHASNGAFEVVLGIRPCPQPQDVAELKRAV